MIEPLQPANVDEVSRFLAAGLGGSADVGPFAPEVLLWKYFDPCGYEASPRSFVARENNTLIGHVGFCPTSFMVNATSGETTKVPTFHMIDWLGSVDHRGVGSALMRHIHELTPTQYAFGTTSAARRSFDAAGYQRIADVPVFRKILRAGYRWRAAENSLAKTIVGTARDAAKIILRHEAIHERTLSLRRDSAFGTEVETASRSYSSSAIFTERSAARLNHLLRHPSGGLEGYTIFEGDAVRGFAVLNLLERGQSRIGRIVECSLDQTSIDLWSAAIATIGDALKERGADALVACGSTPWTAEALQSCGFSEVFQLESRLRDPSSLVARARPFHSTFLEADYSYLP